MWFGKISALVLGHGTAQELQPLGQARWRSSHGMYILYPYYLPSLGGSCSTMVAHWTADQQTKKSILRLGLDS